MFKVGDKVVRKAKYNDSNWWPYGTTPLIVISSAEMDTWFKDVPEGWSTDYFELYVEPVIAPAPKFKVGDRVKPKLGSTGTLITKVTKITEYRYDTDSKMINVREEKLELSDAPRTVTVDGIVYREGL